MTPYNVTMEIDEVMRLWRLVDKKFRDSDKQPEDYRNFANRIGKLAKLAPAKLKGQWLEQAINYRRIADAVEKLHQ